MPYMARGICSFGIFFQRTLGAPYEGLRHIKFYAKNYRRCCHEHVDFSEISACALGFIEASFALIQKSAVVPQWVDVNEKLIDTSRPAVIFKLDLEV